MSAIAVFHKLARSKIPDLEAAATPRKKLFGRAEDRYFDFLAENPEKLGDYAWSGYVSGTVLPFLDDKGIQLMSSGYDELGGRLTEARNATHFIFTSDHKNAYFDALDPGNFSKDELRTYYEAFNEEGWPQAGDAMMDAVVALRDSLQTVDDESIIVFGVF